MKNINFVHLLKDPIYTNSIYYMSSTFILGALGFLFWIIVARLFTEDDIGIATALISTSTLLISLSSLGLNTSLIKYLPKSENKSQLISSSLLFIIISTCIFSILFVFLTPYLSPKLIIIKDNILIIITYVIFVIFLSLNSLIESIFIAFRATKFILIKNIILSLLKLILPVIMVAFGAFGIFSAASISTMSAVLIAIIFLKFYFSIDFVFNVNQELIKKMSYFSAGNYVTNFLYQAPLLLMPILILNKLSSIYSAYFYINTMILNFIIIIPIAITQVLLAEGSYDDTGLIKHTKKAIVINYLLLLPSVVIICTLGSNILHFFGKNYALESFKFLQLIAISTIFMSLTHFANSLLRIRNNIKTLFLLNLFGSLIVLASSYKMISGGLLGVGVGWLSGQIIFGVLSIFVIWSSIKNN